MHRRDNSTHNNRHHTLSRGWTKKLKQLANKRQRQKGKVR